MNEIENIEIALLLEGIYRLYGYDLRDYAQASLKRRVQHAMQQEGVATVSAFQERILHNRAALERFMRIMAIDVTALFRDPSFYVAFRQKAVPLLRTYPFVRVWHAGCAGGEEAYSMAIVLHEEGLLERARIYATDMNAELIEEAEKGIYSLSAMQSYTSNYQQAGGTATFSDYYTARYDNAILRPALKKNLVFAQHNLVSDSSFNEFNVILCRNVMIYFNRKLQDRVHNLLYASLAPFGILGLGSKESLKFTVHEKDYEELDERERLYRRKN